MSNTDLHLPWRHDTVAAPGVIFDANDDVVAELTVEDATTVADRIVDLVNTFKNVPSPAALVAALKHIKSPLILNATVLLATYRLQSCEVIHAPGVVQAAINDYKLGARKEYWERVLTKGWPGFPPAVAKALLTGQLPYAIDGETVVVNPPADLAPVPKEPPPVLYEPPADPEPEPEPTPPAEETTNG